MMNLAVDSPRARAIIFGISLLVGALFVTAMTFLLDPDGLPAALLLDRQTRIAPYPFTVQNIIWLMFFAGMGELVVRLRQSGAEARQTGYQLLPEDDTTMLRADDLRPIYREVNPNRQRNNFFLQRLISRCILQFQGGRSVNQANSLLNTSLELFQHQIDLKYGMLRYLVWLIPSLGFIGTLIGIALAMETAGNVPDVTMPGEMRPWMNALTADLGVAFYTTLLALLLSVILVFLLHIAQEREEMALNSAGQYCLDNLIIRLYEK